MSRSSRCLLPLSVLLVAGCLPPLPPLAGDTDGIGSDGDGDGDGDLDGEGTTAGGDWTEDPTAGTVGGEDSGSDEAGEQSTGADSTGDGGSASDDAADSDDGTTGGEPGDCPAIDALSRPGEQPTAVSNCQFLVDFDPGTPGLSELRALEGSGQDLLFHHGAALETETGVVQWAFNTSASSSQASAELQHGPAVHRVRVPWNDAGAEGAGFEGVTIYTVIADGRILRDDYVHVLEEEGDWLVSFNALRADVITDLAWDGISQPAGSVPIEADGAVGITPLFSADAVSNDGYLCAYDHAHGDAVGFAEYEGPNSTWVGPRASRDQQDAGDPSSTSVVLQADWLRSAAVLPSEYFGESMLHIGAAPAGLECEAIYDHYLAYRQPGGLTVTEGGSVLTGQSGDVVNYDGHSEGGGFYSIQAESGDTIVASLSGGVSTYPSVLLHIAGLSAADVTGVDLGGTTLGSGEYLVQDAQPELHEDALAAGVFVLIAGPIQESLEIAVHH
ncbi:MAG: hypothetical protein AAF721_29275 [Myxococcota bacterium]